MADALDVLLNGYDPGAVRRKAAAEDAGVAHTQAQVPLINAQAQSAELSNIEKQREARDMDAFSAAYARSGGDPQKALMDPILRKTISAKGYMEAATAVFGMNKKQAEVETQNAQTAEAQARVPLIGAQANEAAARVPLIGAQANEANARVPLIQAQTAEAGQKTAIEKRNQAAATLATALNAGIPTYKAALRKMTVEDAEPFLAFGDNPTVDQIRGLGMSAKEQTDAADKDATRAAAQVAADALAQYRKSQLDLTKRGQDVSAATQRRGQDMTAENQATARRETAKANQATDKAVPILDKVQNLSEQINTDNGLWGKITGAIKYVGGKANLNDTASEYDALIDGAIPLVARALGHTGVLTEQDVASTRHMFPQVGESKSLAQAKMKQIREIIQGQAGQAAGPNVGGLPAVGSSFNGAKVLKVEKVQ